MEIGVLGEMQVPQSNTILAADRRVEIVSIKASQTAWRRWISSPDSSEIFAE